MSKAAFRTYWKEVAIDIRDAYDDVVGGYRHHLKFDMTIESSWNYLIFRKGLRMEALGALCMMILLLPILILPLSFAVLLFFEED